MSYLKKYTRPEPSTSSMADIAFLMLTFFLVTTQIQNDRGLTLLLPPFVSTNMNIHERNVFNVQINSNDQYLIEHERRQDLSGLRNEIKRFVLNNGREATLSDSPDAAIVSLKTDRGTSYRTYINALDEIQGAYYEIYAERIGISSDRFRSLDLSNIIQKNLYDRARRGLPMNVSIAEPTKLNN